jgi:DNA-binding cell septation regulator SpoVG
MATMKKSGKKQEAAATDRQTIEVSSWNVSRARETRRGFYFTLTLNYVQINNCHIVEMNDGTVFIGLPQYKGSDGNYYNQVYAPLDDDLQQQIIDEVVKQAAANS